MGGRAPPTSGGRHMARWEPRTLKENLQANLDRIKKRIQAKQQEIKDLELEAKQAEQAINAVK